MRFTIKKSYHYFCCSTLSLLNGDIHDVILENTTEIIGARIKQFPIDLVNMFEAILEFLIKDYSTFKHKMPYKIKKEYKRMIRLYKFRIKELEVWR